MSGVQTITVTTDEAEMRLDRWFKRHFPALGHGRLEKLLRTGQVRIDGKRAAAGDRLAAGQAIRVPPMEATPPPERKRAADPRDAAMLEAAILHRDDAVIVLNKPAGLAVQGGSGTPRHLDGMLDLLQFDAAERPRLVHRLDRDTSGVLLLARTARAAQQLTAAFRGKDTEKLYWAAVAGVPHPRAGRIDLPLAKTNTKGRERVAYDDEAGQKALTLYETLDTAFKRAAWLALTPVTGRTHQLRVHCAAIGTPILGDGKYGGADAFLAGAEIARQVHLHARRIRVPHPAGGILEVEAPLPQHMRATWKYLGFSAG